MKKAIVGFALAGTITGCATSPDSMQTSYISPTNYHNYSCEQISAETQRVSRRESELYGILDKKASTDNAQMAAGMLIFWPALFFLEGGDGPEAAEYSRLKGENEALSQAAIQKNCGTAVAASQDASPAS